MASFWGEILPVTSRAVTDDDDEEEEEINSSRPQMKDCNMIWNPELTEECLPCRLLIIADGEAAAQFVDAALLWQKESTLAGVLNSGFVQSEGQFPPKSVETSKSCSIHRLHSSTASAVGPSVVVVRNTSHVFPEQLYSWHRELFSRLSFDAENLDVVVLTTANVINYLEGPNSASLSLEPPFLRSLCTQKTMLTLKEQSRKLPPKLETPNILDGVAAQVLTHCQISGLRAAVFVTFASGRLEASTIEAFAPLRAPGGILHGVANQNPDLKTAVRDFVLKKDQGSLLYT